jgi:hypothetical protein
VISLLLGVVVPTNDTSNNESVNDDDTNPGWVDGLAIITAVFVVAIVTVPFYFYLILYESNEY